MCARRAEIANRGQLDLPLEIWQRIAKHMSTEEWVAASRTCRTTYAVQPEEIDLEIHNKTHMSWVVNHWGRARRLHLYWAARSVPRYVAECGAGLACVKRMHLGLDHTPSDEKKILRWLVDQAPQLRLLSISQYRAVAVPLVQNLSHLLVTSDAFTKKNLASIEQLSSLRTLWLGKLNPAENYDGADCPVINLAGLLHLTSVAVDCVAVPEIILPEPCSLHLFGSHEPVLYLNSWDAAAEHGQLRSIDLIHHHAEEDDLPILLKESKCTFLNYCSFERLGESHRPVLFEAARFQCLTHLKISGMSLHITLPQALNLKVLHAKADDLSIKVECPTALAQGLQELKVVYEKLEGCDIFDVVAVMTGMG